MTQQTMFTKIAYAQLNSRQQENYNFQKISAILADYGFVTMRLSDDWQGADFIAQHTSGTFLKVQLKGRLEINKKYIGKEIWMCFPTPDWKGCYLFAHDDVKDWLLANTNAGKSLSWSVSGVYNWKTPSKAIKAFLEDHKLAGIQ
ncbi:hypothetical protein GCM10027578_17580 [Spirosoma luteolum]